jgi:hypothetical protein
MSKGTIVGLAALAGIGAVVATQAPEIQRYIKIKSM